MKRGSTRLENKRGPFSNSKDFRAGEAEVPLTELALDAFRKQLAISGRRGVSVPERGK